MALNKSIHLDTFMNSVLEIPITSKRLKNKPMPLVIEPHSSDIQIPQYGTYIQFKDTDIFAIVDNVDDNHILCYVVDFCGPEQVEVDLLLKYGALWWEYNQTNDICPFSVYISREGVAEQLKNVHRTYHVDSVTRVVGPLPHFPLSSDIPKKRRKLKAISRLIQQLS